MKSVSGKVFVTTLVIAIVAVAVSFAGGWFGYQAKHECSVDKETGKANCKA